MLPIGQFVVAFCEPVGAFLVIGFCAFACSIVCSSSHLFVQSSVSERSNVRLSTLAHTQNRKHENDLILSRFIGNWLENNCQSHLIFVCLFSSFLYRFSFRINDLFVSLWTLRADIRLSHFQKSVVLLVCCSAAATAACLFCAIDCCYNFLFSIVFYYFLFFFFLLIIMCTFCSSLRFFSFFFFALPSNENQFIYFIGNILWTQSLDPSIYVLENMWQNRMLYSCLVQCICSTASAWIMNMYISYRLTLTVTLIHTEQKRNKQNEMRRDQTVW